MRFLRGVSCDFSDVNFPEFYLVVHQVAVTSLCVGRAKVLLDFLLLRCGCVQKLWWFDGSRCG